MRENVGRIDRIVRSVIGSALMVGGGVQLRRRDGVLAGVLAMIGGALTLESAITRVCPLNHLLGIDSRSNAERLKDFRADVNEQTDRIQHDYGQSLPT